MYDQGGMPNLFLIGGMKCGSTTLYADLATHGEIHAPEVKEPTFFEREELSSEQVGDLYRKLHRGGEGCRYRMDGSTRYSMRTELEDIPGKVRELCGEDVRIVYMVRNPLDRIASHYRHGFGAGSYTGSLAEALDSDPALIDHSRYAWQLEPWREVFGDDKIFVMQFEAFIEDRKGAVEAVERWLGLEPETGGIDPEERRNASEGKTAPPGFLAAITRSPLYKTNLSLLLPKTLLHRLKRVTHRRLPEAEAVWTPESKAKIIEELKQDVVRISGDCSFPLLPKGEFLWDDFQSGNEDV